MAAEEIIAVITCPFCRSNDQATVHLTRKKARFYVRCYQGIGGTVQLCGTLLAYGPEGQAAILAALEDASEIRRPDLMPGETAARTKAPDQARTEPPATKAPPTKDAQLPGERDEQLDGPSPDDDTPEPQSEPEPTQKRAGGGWLLDL